MTDTMPTWTEPLGRESEKVNYFDPTANFEGCPGEDLTR
jgi:hypothetical protein